MRPHSIYNPEPTAALTYAADALGEYVSGTADAPYWLYGVPTPAFLRDDIPKNKWIIGGNLDFLPEQIQRIDLLKDPFYLAQNAAITAEAALPMILDSLQCGYSSADTLVIGWGRIGKCLCRLLAQLGIPVSVFARKEQDRAMLRALGYRTAELTGLSHYRCIVNTAPAHILTPKQLEEVRPDCCLLELASERCIPSERTIHARGLPGKRMPEASGQLIAQTILRHLNSKED